MMNQELPDTVTKLIEDIETSPAGPATAKAELSLFLREQGLESLWLGKEIVVESHILLWNDEGRIESFWELNEERAEREDVVDFLVGLIRMPLRYYVAYACPESNWEGDLGVWHARDEDDVFRQMYELFYEEWDDFPDVAYMLELSADCESDSNTDYVWLMTTVAAIESAWLTSREEWPYDGNLEDDQRIRFSRFVGFESGEWSVDIEVDPNDVLDGWFYNAFTAELDEVLSVF